MSFNLREEPVIFVGLNHDYVPYSPRDPSSLKGNIANHGVKPEELAENELKIREEVNILFLLLPDLSWYIRPHWRLKAESQWRSAHIK